MHTQGSSGGGGRHHMSVDETNRAHHICFSISHWNVSPTCKNRFRTTEVYLHRFSKIGDALYVSSFTVRDTEDKIDIFLCYPSTISAVLGCNLLGLRPRSNQGSDRFSVARKMKQIRIIKY